MLVLDVLDGDLELRVLARDVLGAVLLRERRLDGALLADRGADEALLEAGDEVARAELDELVATLAAGERLAVHRALEVDRQEVAVLGGALDGVQVRRALAQARDLVVDLLLGDGRLAQPDLDAAVGAERRGRAHADLEGERQRLALAGQVAEVDLGVADRGDARVVDRVHVPAGEPAADGLVEDRLAPEALDDDRRRDLALAKARELHLAPELARLHLERALHLLGSDLGFDAHARMGKLGDGGLDCGGHGLTLSSRHPPTPSPPRRPFAALDRHRARSGTSTRASPTGSAAPASYVRARACACAEAPVVDSALGESAAHGPQAPRLRSTRRPLSQRSARRSASGRARP